MVWRGVRYMSAVFAGYLLGLASGAVTANPPSFVVIALVGALALFLIFRKGQQSNSHAAVDAILEANARANAMAVNSNTITVAGGHVVGQQPPVEAYDRDVWAEFAGTPNVEACELIGTDPITGALVFRTVRGYLRADQLNDAERRSVQQVEIARARSVFVEDDEVRP